MNIRISNLVKQISIWKVKSRLIYSNGKLGSWTHFLLVPVPNYIESTAGPIPIRDVSFIEIEFTKTVRIGRLIKPKEISLEGDIIEFLNTLELSYEKINDDYLRVNLQL